MDVPPLCENLTSASRQGAATAYPVAAHASEDALAARIEAACEQACQAIAPVWPLDRAIAVNPHWARTHRGVRQVAARMAVLGGIQVFPSRSYFSDAWTSERITHADLSHALVSLPAARARALTAKQCIDALRDGSTPPQLPLLLDVLDDDPMRHTRLSWRQAITHQVSQTCAAYFDEHQADWQPDRSEGLYAFWRDTLTHDHGIGTLMGIPELGKSLGKLPADRREAERWVLERVGLAPAVWVDYLEAVLLTVNGWASWCAYLRWQARLASETDPHLRDLLAIRLAWGAILLESKGATHGARAFAALQAQWSRAPSLLQHAEDLLVIDEVWQMALEAGYQRQLMRKLHAVPRARLADLPGHAIEVQAAFCIDVRSEPLRRSIEAVWPAVQTIGFAGFFGLPAAYTPLATSAARPQLPGLLAPSLAITDRITAPRDADACDEAHLNESASRARRRQFALAEQGRSLGRWPAAAFSFVESAGIGYLGKLAQWILPPARSRERDELAGRPARYRSVCRPTIVGLDIQARVALAAHVLRSMGLDRHLAPMVVFVGHGSQSSNNAHAAALDCGACCGQTGEVNARALAQLLNDPLVREGLRKSGIVIPHETVFVAALHNTTTDEIEGFDLDLLPSSALERWDRVEAAFAQAGDQVRRERAVRLGIDPRTRSGELRKLLRRRANDGAQTRPEWGLAGNAACVIAPRRRTQGAVLDGRCFLHDYDADHDPDGRLLEQLMTGPLLVAHWINWQYHASTCDPLHLGSGNKVLHNVVGRKIGVFEGNGGDLRVGLARQSVHDGKQWVHEPLRMTVIIDAPQRSIDRVLNTREEVSRLVDQSWLHLWRFDDSKLIRYADGKWLALTL
ncbi:DUF2309 domain-containing protein [Paraburkholderia sp. SUR17]|uniref:YbcC family protein n=1 Tax=Paraburkholderia sp. SUR17 TaxID=3034358 RepID=UPI002407B96A|nr:DUF2309 domain-containing protein [Paraburkholderia sp. SUR17]WEY37681.1 DUF2309 domain-containing protein [Paraburkholderia sp. SUR17]